MPYRAISKDNLPGPVTTCPKQAAREFFAAYPTKRICSVISGTHATGRFIAAPYVPGNPPEHWRNVTRSTIETMGRINALA